MDNTKTERVSIKENTSNIANLASLTTSLGFIQSQIAEVRADVKAITGVFASKEELSQTAREVEIRIARLEKASNLWRWLSPTLSAILAWVIGSAITFLLISYLAHIKN